MQFFQLIAMKRLSTLLSAAALVAALVPPVSAYDHSSYNQSGLVIQYDGPDNGEDDAKLVNFGSGGSEFDLLAMTKDDRVVDGEIVVGHLDAGNYKPHGWKYDSAASAEAGDGAGWTIEYVGARSGGESKNGYSYVIGLDNGSDSGRLLYLASGQNEDTSIGAEGMAGSYNYEGTSFVKGANWGTVQNAAVATRTVTLDTATKTLVFYENGVKIGEGKTAGGKIGGVKRVHIGDMRAGRAYGWWEGKIKSVRIYSRVLSDKEVAGNYDIDGYRFYGKVSSSGQLVIANNPAAVGEPSPAAGLQSPALGETVNCTATEPFYLNGVRYAASGYTLETSSDGGTTWSEPVFHAGTAYDYVNEGVTTRLIWQWQPTHYRLYVTRNGGAETFSFSPEATIEDPNDTKTPGGYYATGASVTVTAHRMTEPVVSAFVKWTGDCSETTDNPIVVAMQDGAKTIRAIFDRPWYMDKGSATGTSVYFGEWELTVESYNDGILEGYAIADCVSGSGVLDMSTLNASLAAQGKLPVVAIKDRGLAGLKELTGLVLPARSEDCATGIQIVGANAFDSDTNLKGPIDFWSVTSLGNCAFLNCSQLGGDLILSALTTIGDRTFKATAYKGDLLDAPELAVCTGEAPFTTVSCKQVLLPKLAVWPKYLFYGSSGITNIVVGTNFTTFGSKIFQSANLSFVTIALPVSAAPTHVDATFEADFDWKLALLIPDSCFGEGWTKSAEFTELEAIENADALINYDQVLAFDRYNGNRTTLRGAWCNKWVLTYWDKSGVVLFFR